MIVIGITGGIGAGKSMASRYLTEKGFELIDADRISHDMTADGAPVLEKLNELFGPEGEYGEPSVEIVKPSSVVDGLLSLDRMALADLVFADKSRKKVFDALMHGEIIDEIDRRIEAIKSGRTAHGNVRGILLDVPLLFETGLQNRCDLVILVTADEQVRIERVINRDGISEEDVRARIRNQMDDSAKAKLADHVVDNSGDYESLKAKLNKILGEIG